MSQQPASTSLGSRYTPEVIEACRRGDRAALGKVFRQESPYLERVLFRVLGPASEREDLLQSALEQAIHAFPAYRGEASVRSWLTRIAVRTAMHHLRHPSQRRRVTLAVVEGGLAVASSSQPAREAEARMRLSLFYEHLDHLDAKHRTAFVLYQVEGRSMEEVAALMDAGLSATKSRVMWARRKLMARFAKDPRARGWLDELAVTETDTDGDRV